MQFLIAQGAKTCFPVHIINNITEFIFDCSCIRFDNVFYNQLYYTTTGNPASYIFANFAFGDSMSIAHSEITESLLIQLSFLKLYVDYNV